MKREKFLEITNYIHNIIQDTEFEQHVYVVGGSVRDLIMEKEIKDIDLVIDLPQGGVRFAEWCKEHNYTNTVVIYATYGTAAMKILEQDIECVMTRGEKYLDNGSRNPTVRFADLKEDAFRRDLTINALYYNISTREILDPTGYGLKDINDKICRSPMELV